MCPTNVSYLFESQQIRSQRIKRSVIVASIVDLFNSRETTRFDFIFVFNYNERKPIQY